MKERNNYDRAADALATVRFHSERVNGKADADALDALISDLMTDLLHLAEKEQGEYSADPRTLWERGWRDFEEESDRA